MKFFEIQTPKRLNWGKDIPRLSISKEEKDLKAGPPYPQEDRDLVKSVQKKLISLDYDVSSMGADGKYGPRTTEGVQAFKDDNNISTPGDTLSADEIEMIMSSKQKAKYDTSLDKSPTSYSDNLDISDAQNVVEEFLGSSISPDEMQMLIRAVAAEASPNAQERAAVAAVILNRVRHSMYPNSISSVLTQKNQFQAVTGTSYDRGPSRNFTNMSNATGEKVMQALVRYLPSMSQSWLNFTSNNPRAYGRGTNINFMYTMRNSDDSEVIGQTVFGTV